MAQLENQEPVHTTAIQCLNQTLWLLKSLRYGIRKKFPFSFHIWLVCLFHLQTFVDATGLVWHTLLFIFFSKLH